MSGARMSVKVHRFMAHRYAILEAYLPRSDRISGRIECMMVFDAGVRCEMDGREDGGWKDEGMQQARLNPLGIGPDAEIGSRADSAASLHLTEPPTCLALVCQPSRHFTCGLLIAFAWSSRTRRRNRSCLRLNIAIVRRRLENLSEHKNRFEHR